MNCIDIDSLKQGHWELNWKKIIYSGYSGYGTAEGCQYFENVELYPRSKGNYEDDKKIGTWDYYSQDQRSGILQKRISYFDNGDIREENFEENFLLNISADSTKIDGFVYRLNDTISFNYSNKLCVFDLTEQLHLLRIEFEGIDRLEYELLRFSLGVYDRNLKCLKKIKLTK